MTKTTASISQLDTGCRSGKQWRAPILFLVSLGLLWTVVIHPRGFGSISPWTTQIQLDIYKKSGFNYQDITPHEHLEYTPCYGGFQCARLDVPLNWNTSNHNEGPRAAIAVVKLPAKVPVTDKRYGGAVIMNPGGPGESGVHTVLSGGTHIQTIIDSPHSPASNHTGKYFDLISFDPRGVNNTMPRLKCFRDVVNQQAWLLQTPDYGLLWDSDSIIGLEWARASVLGASCATEREDADMVRYLNTAQVVEDMLEIVERHGEWRQAEAKRLLHEDHCGQKLKPDGKKAIAQRTMWKQGHENILYWGISYGSLLGETFAAMHPDRVERLVIDGVLNPEDYYTGAWMKNLQDSDMIITKYCEYCHEAGPSKCTLYTGSSGADVEARLTNVMLSLKDSPIPVPASDIHGPEVVTYGDALLQMLSAMYFPHAYAEDFFSILLSLEAGNGTQIAHQKQAIQKAEVISADCLRDGPFSDACASSTYVSMLGTFQTVACMDSGGGQNFTKEAFKEYWDVLKGQSKWISTSWARNKVNCVGYTTQPAWKFEGPIMGNLLHPMLLIGNTHDTVTPIGKQVFPENETKACCLTSLSARHVSNLFPGSVVLHQDSQGHASYSMPSLCTGKALREYFQSGALPEVGTICIPEIKPFIGCMHKDSDGNCRKRSEEEATMWDAMVSLTEVWP